jgi:hypothetical protein
VARIYTPKDFEVSRIMGDIVDVVAEHPRRCGRSVTLVTHASVFSLQVGRHGGVGHVPSVYRTLCDQPPRELAIRVGLDRLVLDARSEALEESVEPGDGESDPAPPARGSVRLDEEPGALVDLPERVVRAPKVRG